MMDENLASALRMRIPLCAPSVIGSLAMLAALNGTAATLTVSNTSASGPGSLQQAILDANASSGLDSIVFQIPGSGVHTIAPFNALPAITDPVVIDGTTQAGFTGAPLIEIDGASAGPSSDGLRLPAGNSTIRGLVINRFGGAGIHVQAPGGTNRIEGNFIGTDPTGTLNRGNGSLVLSGGVWIDGSSGNWIGGLDPTNRNLVSGNSGPGVLLQNCSGNTVQGNLIGTSLSGAAALGNSGNGISLHSAAGNQIGGTVSGARNVLSGNGGSGVYLFGPPTTGNLVQGNYIGTDAAGTLALPNAGDGVTINAAPANTIGGASTGAGNLLSGNSRGGVSLQGFGTDRNLVQGNFIGTDASGGLALGNTYSGITILSGNSNLIGGAIAAARNIVSANKLAGVYIATNSVGNVVQGNIVGLDATGAVELGNLFNGISIDSAAFNTVGGMAPGARNIISGNGSHGIEIYHVSAASNSVQGNYIGTDITGQSARANRLCGLHIQSPGNVIGGTADGAGNLISGNTQDGIFLDGADAANNIVQGNWIGTGAGGKTSLKNARGGVGISWAPGNTIGGTAPGAGNLLSGNTLWGTYLIGTGATGNLIQGNKIGTDVTGTAKLGNNVGIWLERALTNTIGGSDPSAGNLISANPNWGVFMTNNASWNTFQGNLIGTALDGLTALGNGYESTGFHAFELNNGCHDNILGGVLPGARNVIAFAPAVGGIYYAGVRVRDSATNNLLSGNAIFSNAGLGIDLGGYLVTANDNCDTDTGANMLQNYPVLVQAVTGNATGIRGTLVTRPYSTFRLQFFASPLCDSYGYGEAQLYLGQTSVVTGNDCNASFVANLPVQVQVGYVITATATDSANNTSEFSACVPMAPVPALAISPLLTNHQVALAWTNTPTGFVLKQTDSLSPPVQWITVTNTPIPTNGQFVVTLVPGMDRRFYALSFE